MTANLVSTGPYIAPLTTMMVATWSAFAHRGDPSNTLLPAWPRYSAEGSKTILLSLESKIASNPDGERRKALDGLPLFEYSMAVNNQNA